MAKVEKNKVGMGVNIPHPIDFAIALHFHQPVGNFNEIFQRTYNNCYLKFLKLLQKHPRVKMSFHFSGSLLSWIEKNHPPFFDLVKELVESNQVEIISGGFYEPILPMISEEDAIGQIKMLTNYINKKFAFKPTGAWIPERIWEPQLASTLNKARIKYAIVDDTHFMKAGLDKSDTYGYYLTGHSLKTVALFGSDKTLRYYIPFKDPKETINYIKRVSQNKKGIFFYGDDAEKFGEWPRTYKLVYEDGWLNNFFKMLIENSEWLHTVTLQEAMARHRPLGKIFIPTASYDEMIKWSGGSWRNFFIKYPESNQMHKKMMWVSKRIKNLKRKTTDKKIKQLLESATEYLYKGQSSCAYWHGIFGGLYLFNLRGAIYENLIKAESTLDRIEYKSANIQTADYNYDNFREIIFSNRLISAYLSPHSGGRLLELDYKPLAANLTNILSRRKESYHRQIKNVKIIYDPYTKSCLLDHIMPAHVTYQQFKAANFREAEDFINRSYSYKIKRSKEGSVIIMKAASGKISIEKKITLYDKISNMRADYSIKNISEKTLDITFGVEFNIVMPDGNPPHNVKAYMQLTSASDFNMEDKEGKVNLQFNTEPASRVWTYSINTISRSEKDYKYNYQGSTVLFNWPLRLAQEKIETFSLIFKINSSTPRRS